MNAGLKVSPEPAAAVLAARNSHFEIVRFLARTAFTLLNTRYEVRGMANLPGDSSFILAMNHSSYLDVPLIWASLPFPTYFVAKDELHHVPVMGRASRLVGNIAIRRGSFSRSALKQSLRYLTEFRRVLGIFVEGTRTPDGEIHQAKPGSALLVLRAGVPVVPAYIEGTYQMWPRGTWVPRWRQRLVIHLGMPLSYPGESGALTRDRLKDVAQEITGALLELKARAEADSPPSGQ